MLTAVANLFVEAAEKIQARFIASVVAAFWHKRGVYGVYHISRSGTLSPRHLLFKTLDDAARAADRMRSAMKHGRLIIIGPNKRLISIRRIEVASGREHCDRFLEGI